MVRNFQTHLLIRRTEKLGLQKIDGETLSDTLLDAEKLWLCDGETLSDASYGGFGRKALAD